MFERLLAEFSLVPAGEILAVGGFNHSSFNKFKRGVRDRKKRESSIPDKDIRAVIDQIISLPFLGGRKGALKLLNEERAFIGETLYAEIKQQLVKLSETSYFSRKKAQLEKDAEERSDSETFNKVRSNEIHEVWAIDYTCFDLLGIRFAVCVVYELYSQAYLAITPGFSENTELAKQAVAEAIAYAGTVPENYLLSDNGAQFCSEDFNKLLELVEIDTHKTPPGQPWYNGALESGNRDLKRTLYTIAFYRICKQKSLARKGIDVTEIFSLLQKCCSAALNLINNKLPRTKFGMTPAEVIAGCIDSITLKRFGYIKEKQIERKERLNTLKETPLRAVKTIEQRVSTLWNKVVKSFDDDTLFAVRELLHGRYNAIKN